MGELMLALGLVGLITVLGNCCALLQRAALPVIFLSAGDMFLASGGSIGNVYFGNEVTKDLQIAAIQSAALLSAGLCLILFSIMRMLLIFMWTRKWSGTTLHYVISICAVSINSFAGFCLLAQPATAQMMNRELGVGDWIAM